MVRINENSRGRLRLEFESVAEIFRTIDNKGWVPQQGKSSDSSKRDSYSSDFYTFENLAEAIDVYRNNPERVRTFDNKDIKLESIESPGKDIYHDVTGDFIDIGRYMDGDPESMGNATLGNPRSIFATVNIMVGYVASTTAEYIERKQRRVLRLVDWLESQNIRCQIVATEVSSVMNFSVVVKQFTDPVDLNDLAVVCHGDFLRRVLFLLMEQSKTWEYGYGDCITWDKRMIQYVPEPEDGMYVYVGGYIPHRSIKELDEAFDKIEEKVFKMVEDNMTWNDEPLAIPGRTMGF